MFDRSPRLGPKAAGLLAAPLLMILLGAAATGLDEARARIRAMTTQQREAIAAALEQFDMRLPPAEQQSLRELDRRLNALPDPEKARFLATLRRYHNWLGGLPESARDGLLTLPLEQRLGRIRTLAAKHPVPTAGTPFWLQFTDMAGPSTFELAAIFTTWKELNPDERKEIERAPVETRASLLPGPGRRALKARRRLEPEGFDLDDWTARAEAKLAELRLLNATPKALPPGEGGPGRRPLLKEQVRLVLLQRYAINLYGLQNPPQAVSPARLARFLDDLPPWIRSTFDSTPADEARRKLTLAYRIVFPPPMEYDPGPPRASSPSRKGGADPGPAGPGAPPSTPVPKKPAANPPQSSSQPF
ncbi:MAG: hypothetical protein U0790_21740 [Isosphaeraceae bacterium]